MPNYGGVLQSLQYKRFNDGYRMTFPTKALSFMLKVHYCCNIKRSEMKHAGIKVENGSLNYMIAYNFPCLI